MWFVFALICILGWGFADLFYKKSSDESDSYSHLRIGIWVGMIMGVCSLILLPFSETGFSLSGLLVNAVKYSPASIGYIVSMVIGYAGLRYLEVSIISPVQNSSGALSAITMVIWFLATGKITSIFDEISVLDLIGSVIIVISIVFLAIVEQKMDRNDLSKEESKLSHSALALVFPILYCVFDTIGTAADGIILDEESGLGLGEIDILILYGLTFLLMSIVMWFYLWLKEKKPYNPFTKKELQTKCVASLFEEFGQVFYVFAMARNPVVAAPMIGSYCIISVIVSRIFIKEKLKASQYACVISVIVGIVILGISEGLAEM